MSSVSLPWRELTYPLNVFVHILMHEEGDVSALHYGLFEREDESLAEAQEHSTELLLSRLPPPPARLLDVGSGLGTTLHRLVAMGYDAEGITPDEKQIAMIKQRFGDTLRVHHAAFETFVSGQPYDVLLFQESSQYIDSEALFARAATLSSRVVVLDEFALQPLDEPGLHSLSDFKAAAARHGFSVVEELDVSAKAAPTMEYFAHRIPLWRDRLIADLGLTDAHIDDLIASGAKYRARYAGGAYGYRLSRLEHR